MLEAILAIALAIAPGVFEASKEPVNQDRTSEGK